MENKFINNFAAQKLKMSRVGLRFVSYGCLWTNSLIQFFVWHFNRRVECYWFQNRNVSVNFQFSKIYLYYGWLFRVVVSLQYFISFLLFKWCYDSEHILSFQLVCVCFHFEVVLWKKSAQELKKNTNSLLPFK